MREQLPSFLFIYVRLLVRDLLHIWHWFGLLFLMINLQMVVGRRFTRKKKNTWHIIQCYKVIHLQEKTLKTVFHCSFCVCLSPRHTTDQMTRLTHLNISFTSPTSPKPKHNHFRMIYEREKRQMSPHKNMEQEIIWGFFSLFWQKKMSETYYFDDQNSCRWYL